MSDAEQRDLQTFSAHAAEVRGAHPDLSDDQIDALRRRGVERAVSAGDVLFREGDSAYDFIVVEGSVAMVDGFGTPRERVVTEHGARRFLGELNLLSGQGVYLTAVVTQPGIVLVLPVSELRQLIAEDEALSDIILRAFLLRRSLLQAIGIGLRIIGSRFSPETRLLLEFVARNRLAYTWIDLARIIHGSEFHR